MRRPYTGWSLRSRLLQAGVNLLAGAVVLYLFLDIFYKFDVALWWLGGLGLSFVAFGIMLPFDREYGHGFASHHVPEVGVVLFAGSSVGAYFHDWTVVVLVVPVFLLFYEIMYIAVKMNKKKATWKQLAKFTLFFAGILAAGMVLGVAYH